MAGAYNRPSLCHPVLSSATAAHPPLHYSYRLQAALSSELRDQSVVHDDQSAAMMCTVILAHLVTPVLQQLVLVGQAAQCMAPLLLLWFGLLEDSLCLLDSTFGSDTLALVPSAWACNSGGSRGYNSRVCDCRTAM